ncbi:MAG TPA: helix-turn-helix transcriptional regulator [Burkholderiaceae bacterium]|jgi:transcriptional regulator with XRE-family HTH domain
MSDPTTALATLGQSLKEMREQRGLRQQDVAERAGLSRLMVIRIEAGKSTVNIGSYARVAAALGAQLQLGIATRPTLDEIGALLTDEQG